MRPAAKRVKVGDRSIDEAALLAGLSNVKQKIEAWGTRNELWHDSGFVVPFLHHGAAPRSDGGTVLLVSEGPIGKVLSGDGSYSEYQTPFTSMLEELGYWYETENHYTFCLSPTDDRLQEDFLSLHRWQWLQHLAERKMFELHSEVFEHFAMHPGDLKRLEWRQFEELLDAIFKNQGFYTELGTGTNDGGVDIRLYQNRAIPEIVTLVQAKRYKNPIKLDAVAALLGIAAEQRAPNAIFATTSYFQPKARNFSLSVEQRVDLPNVELADSSRIGGWCAEIGQNLNNYFSKGLAEPPMIPKQTGPDAGSIVVAHGGYDCRMNYFAKVEADFPHEVILRPIGSEIVSGDWAYGSEVPSESARVTWSKKARLLGFKKDDNSFWVDSGEYYWDCNHFEKWDGKPQHFHSD
jgi:restriction system protein